jgi:O-antigen/teichoic acid export membrane protein
MSENPLAGLARTLVPSAVRMAGAGLQFLSTVIVARVLGDEPGAGFFFWSSVVMTAGPIATYGLEQIALRNVPRLHEKGPAAVGAFLATLRFTALLASMIIGIGLIGFEILSERSEKGFQIWHLLPPIALASIALNLINGEALKGLSRPVMAVVFGHLIPVSLFCLLTVLFARNLASPGVLLLYTVSYLTGALAIRYCPAPDCRGPLISRPDAKTFREILRDGFPVCCVNLFGAMGFIVPLAMLELTRPAAEVAYITTAFRISILFIVLSSAIHGVFAPALSRTAILPHPFVPLFRVYRKAVLITLASLILPLAAGIAMPELVMSVFGESFRNGAAALRLLLVLQLIGICIGPVPYLLLMTGHTVILARLGVLKLVATVALSLFLIPRFGGVGMVQAMGIAFITEQIIGLCFAVIKLRRHQPTAEVNP